MSSGKKLPWADAFAIASQVADQLKPVTARLKAAGSLRRQRPEVSDLEMVAEPLLVPDGFLGDLKRDIEIIRATLARMGQIVKSGPRYTQVTHLLGHEGVTLDLFLAYEPATWGSILAIRTGPRELGQYCVTRMHAFGLRHVDGHIENDRGRVISTENEIDFFNAARIKMVPPNQRDDPQKAYEPIPASDDAVNALREACSP